MSVSQELLDCSNSDENFQKHVKANDESWMYGKDIETSTFVALTKKAHQS